MNKNMRIKYNSEVNIQQVGHINWQSVNKTIFICVDILSKRLRNLIFWHFVDLF